MGHLFHEVSMFKVISCVIDEHDWRLLVISAVICVLGCLTTTTLIGRADQASGRKWIIWSVIAALVFGCSVWALHFVAMLAYRPGQKMPYDVVLTLISVVFATLGALFAMVLRGAQLRPVWRYMMSGAFLTVGIAGMHYVGVMALRVSAVVSFERPYVQASLVIGLLFAMIAMWRGRRLDSFLYRLEVAGWLSLSICCVHFIGMAAVTIDRVAPSVPFAGASAEVLGSRALAIGVGVISALLLIASLCASLVEQSLFRRTKSELSRMRLMSNLTAEGLLIHRGGIVLEVNNACERLSGRAVEKLIGQPVLDLFPEDSHAVLKRFSLVETPVFAPEEVMFSHAGGAPIPVELKCQQIDYLGKPATMMALRDLTDRKRDEARIRHLALHDALTTLPNRYNLLQRIEQALASAQSGKTFLAVAFLDLDRFKLVNDLYGHAAGDAVLVEASRRILSVLPPPQTIARVGGDEFVILLTNDGRPEDASVVVTRVLEALQKPFQIDGHSVDIDASAGVAFYPGDADTAETLIGAADAAMYGVKRSGRGAMQFYEASMNAHLKGRLKMQQELAGAAERGELLLQYQPIVHGATGEVEIYEALLRWQHPMRGLVPPGEFIPLAEETGLIAGIGRWVILTACWDAAGWPAPCKVSINISPRQFQLSDICAILAEAIAETGLDPARIVLEVTESLMIADAQAAIDTLTKLRAQGVRIALDDFGTGYSSLSYLHKFKFDKIKIDRSFVGKLEQQHDALIIVNAIMRLSHDLGLKVVAEGVETLAQLEVLQRLGCDQIQGYLIAKPASVTHYTDIDQLRTRALFAVHETAEQTDRTEMSAESLILSDG